MKRGEFRAFCRFLAGFFSAAQPEPAYIGWVGGAGSIPWLFSFTSVLNNLKRV